MNIAEILKDCPKGTKLYSPLFGECELISIDYDHSSIYPITIKVGDDNHCFTKNGLFFIEYVNAECMLFPSKNNRDWLTFNASEKEYEFKPFDKVLVRDDNSVNWDIDLFSHINNDVDEFKYVCLDDSWNKCIPYEGNEHLLGTTNNPN